MLLKFLILGLLFTEAFSDASPDCKASPERSFMKCCKIPQMMDYKLSKEIHEEEKTEAVKNNRLLMFCIISQKYFDQKKWAENGEIKVDAIEKEIDEKVKDESWNLLLKSKVKGALTKVDEKAAELEKLWSSWNVTKESCNTKMGSVIGYVAMGLYAECPSQSWTDKEDCNKGKEFMTGCQDDLDAVKKWVETVMNA